MLQTTYSSEEDLSKYSVCSRQNKGTERTKPCYDGSFTLYRYEFCIEPLHYSSCGRCGETRESRLDLMGRCNREER